MPDKPVTVEATIAFVSPQYAGELVARIRELDALLVQRAQAINELQASCDRRAKAYNELAEKLDAADAALTARTQALDQLQAENEALKLGRYHGPLDTREHLLHRRCQRAESDVSRLLARERAAQDALAEMTARMVAAVEARERYALEVRNLQAADAARVSRAPQLSEEKEDASRVAPLKAGAAATGSTAEDRTGNAESAERTE